MAQHTNAGEAGDMLAADFLQAKGYVIMEMNWRFRKADVNIIARIDDCIVFAEVKTRNTPYQGQPEESVNPARRKLVQQAANAYLEQYGIEEETTRFDIVAIVQEEQGIGIYHLEDAFWPKNKS